MISSLESIEEMSLNFVFCFLLFPNILNDFLNSSEYKILSITCYSFMSKSEIFPLFYNLMKANFKFFSLKQMIFH